MRIKKLNEVSPQWKEFADSYYIGDDGHIYRRLKSGYCRDKRYPYRQVRGSYGTEKQHTVKNHVACALAFVPKPEGDVEIDHIDNDKSNNRADNLRWVTHQENVTKMFKDNKRRKGA